MYFGLYPVTEANYDGIAHAESVNISYSPKQIDCVWFACWKWVCWES